MMDLLVRCGFTRRLILLGLVVYALLSRTCAAEPSKRVSQYIHTAWRVSEGALLNAPTAVAQTRDGYMWVASNSGLQRFDGVRFTTWTPPAGTKLRASIRSLYGGRDGSLWIGGGSGIQRWKDGHLTTYPSCRGTILGITESIDGTIWFTRAHALDGVGALCSITSNGETIYGQKEGDPFTYAGPVIQDASGAIWTGSTLGVFSLNHGIAASYLPAALKPSEGLEGVEALALDKSGALIVGMLVSGNGLGLQVLRNGKWAPYELIGLKAESLEVQSLLQDRSGGLWIGTSKHGLIHSLDGVVDRFDASHGLSGNLVGQIQQDHEGNVWVVTTKGLDRFRESAVTTFSSEEGLVSDTVGNVVAGRAGEVWVGQDGGLSRIKGTQVTTIGRKEGFPGKAVTGLLEDSSGDLWVGVDNGLFIFHEGRFTEVLRKDGSKLGVVQLMIEDADHTIWLAKGSLSHSIIHISQKKEVEEIEASKTWTGMFLMEPFGRGILVGIGNGSVLQMEGTGREELDQPKGSPPAVLYGFLVNNDGSFWAATGTGLQLVLGTKRMFLTSVNGLPCEKIYSLIRDGHGSIWGTSECGYIKISEEELGQWRAHRQTVLNIAKFDALDGAQPGNTIFRPTIAQSKDGRLWFANANNVQTIDPADRNATTLAPPVHVERVSADGKSVSFEHALRLLPLTKEIQIDYTALSFTIPQRVYFKYRLDGVGEGWHEAGTRRQAFYENLPPGQYTFHVIACNGAGIWNLAGASFSFVIPPAYYQTTWFLLLCVSFFCLLTWVLFLSRLRQATAKIHSHLAERVRERERIARELHDTLLQGFNGLMLRFHVATALVPPLEPAHPMLEDALDQADLLMVESRQRIRDLRNETEGALSLPDALAAFGEETRISYPMAFQVTTEGSPRLLTTVVQEEVYLIGREAMLNSFRHSGGVGIEVEVAYEKTGLCLRIRDDGRGLKPEVLEAKGAKGHWGLSGMHERAENIGAQIRIWNREGSGCEIEVKVPDSVAYREMPNASSLHRFWCRCKKYGRLAFTAQ